MKCKHGLGRKLLVWLIVLTVVPLPFNVYAADGLPDSPEFGYGAQLSMVTGNQAYLLDQASQIGLDWVAIQFDWAQLWPDPNTQPDLSIFVDLVHEATQRDLSLMIVFRDSPAWAMTADGPKSDATAAAVLSLIDAFPGQFLAIELFPGANTVNGWGAMPNPGAYLAVYRSVQSTLASHSQNTIVIPSITPLSTSPTSGDMDDLAFLKTLYEAGAQFPIVGLRYANLNSEPLTNPEPGNPDVLRHYELVRQFMLDKGFAQDRIWITGFSWPMQIVEPASQAQWLNEAFILLKAQLYIGAAFFTWLNPPTLQDTWAGSTSLILPDSSLHPAWRDIRLLAAGNSTDDLDDLMIYQPLVKKLVKTANYKRRST